MKEKGFTLIELLAVIVILAIVALIATPIILGIIKDAKEEANKRSIDNYAKALQNSIVKYQLKGNKNITGKFEPKKLENNKLSKTIIINEELELNIEYEGNVVCEEIEIYEAGKIYLGKCKVNDNYLDYTYGTKIYNDGDIVYFDVINGVGCTEKDYHEDNSITGYNGYIYKDLSNKEISKLITQNSCLKFYAFLDNGGKTLNLLLDHNTTANSVDWTNSSTTSNEEGQIDVIKQLKIDTDSWYGTITPENYKYKASEKEYTVFYNTEEYKSKARLITAQEIAQITGADKEPINWQETAPVKSLVYYFDSLSMTQSDTCKVGDITGCKYGWLYDRTATYCRSYGCLNSAVNPSSNSRQTGYWTSSASALPGLSWAVNYYSTLRGVGIDCSNGGSSEWCEYGIRPVIEVLKTHL